MVAKVAEARTAMDATAAVAYTAASRITVSARLVMSRIISVALLAGGIVLLYFGGQSFHSLNDSMSRFFTGSPATKTILLIAGGAVASLVGLIGLAMPGGKR
jgi:NO-binding membrane sensor protein with MHYT domain